MSAVERIAVAGLHAPAEILVDHWGIPHIYAGSEDDAFFAQGFNAARDRLFQMDLWRRRGLGFLSEAFGPAYVEQDTATRLFLYRGDMDDEWAAYDAAGAGGARRVCARFTAGVNAWVDRVVGEPDLLPWEFREFGYRPARWQPDDVVRIRTHAMVRNVGSEVARANVAARAGLAADVIRLRLSPDWTTCIPEGLDVDLPRGVLRAYNFATQPVKVTRESLASADPATTFVPAADLPPDALEGSNNWVVAPSRSATGRPILANDPHRAFGAPTLRYVAHVCAPGLDVIGAGEPAIPGVTIGHNGTAAFGFTIFFADQEDLYVYELHPDDPTRYRYDGGWEKFRIFVESIPVKGRAAAPVALLFTRHGPVVFVEPAARPGKPRRAFAVRTVWVEPGTSPYFGSLGAMRAQTYDAFCRATAAWGTPGENLVYADTGGTIGWVAAARVPRRPNWDGLLPVPGDGRYEWDGYLTGDELPSMANPAAGFIATANQLNLPADYPYRALKPGFEWPSDARYRRLAALLAENAAVTLDDCARMQNDLVSLPARRLSRWLATLRPCTGDAEAARAMLAAWDGTMDADSAAAALFEVWLARHLAPAFLSAALGAQAVAIAAPDLAVLVPALEASAAATVRAMAEASLAAAWREIATLLGDDSSRWQWGRLLHHLSAHPLSGAVDPARRAAIDIGPLSRGGSAHTPNMGAYRPADFLQTLGPSLRMIIDVGAWDASRVVNHPGQSGDPASPHYRDHAGLWARGEYVPLVYTRAAVEAATQLRIELAPAMSALSA